MNDLVDSTEIEEAEEEVNEREIAPAQARNVTRSFTEMKAWQQEMRRNPDNATDTFYGSKKKFMENCRAIYPVEVVDVSQSGTEIVKSRQELEGLDQIPNLQSELAKTAHNIRIEQVQDPLQLVGEINRVIEPASRVINQYIVDNPGFDFEAGSQLDQCFREIYRLEILREALESSLTAKQKEDLAAGKEKTQSQEETPEEHKARINKELEANWDRLLKEQFQMSVDRWFQENMPGDADWTMFGADTEKWQRLHDGMGAIKRDYLKDERTQEAKIFEYKVRLNELLSSI